MSEVILSESTASVTLIASEQSNPSIPSWFAEAVLLAQYWKDSGLLATLIQTVHVLRGRMGDYEVQDFVLLLLAYAVSCEPNLKVFFEHLKPVKQTLMSVWDRKKTPHRSVLSRFLRDVSSQSVEQLRDLFDQSFQQTGIPLDRLGGLFDRQGTRHIVFDVDGKKKRLVSGPYTRGKTLPRYKDEWMRSVLPVTRVAKEARLSGQK